MYFYGVHIGTARNYFSGCLYFNIYKAITKVVKSFKGTEVINTYYWSRSSHVSFLLQRLYQFAELKKWILHDDVIK